MKAVISEKGQVTIPKKLRDKLGLTAGTAIEFQDRKGTLIGKKSLREMTRLLPSPVLSDRLTRTNTLRKSEVRRNDYSP